MNDQGEKQNEGPLATGGAGVSISGGKIGSMKVSRVSVPNGSVALLVENASVEQLEADQLLVRESPEKLWALLACELEKHRAELGSAVDAPLQDMREAAVGKPDSGRAKALLRWASGVAEKIASAEATRLIGALFRAHGL